MTAAADSRSPAPNPDHKDHKQGVRDSEDGQNFRRVDQAGGRRGRGLRAPSYESSPPTSVTARSHTASRHPGVGPNSGSRSELPIFVAQSPASILFRRMWTTHPGVWCACKF
jgi:hypothetical protein